MKDTQTFMFASNFDLDFFFQPVLAYGTTDGGQTWTKSNPIVNPSVINYIPDTDNDFIISGQTVGVGVEAGITGTVRTSDLENWEIVDDKGLLAADFIGETQNIGTYANYPGTVEAGIMYNWSPPALLDYDAAVSRSDAYPYTIVTLNHLGSDFFYEYELQNTGVNSIEGAIFNLEVILDGTAITTESETIDIGQDLSQKVLLFYEPTAVGTYQFNITASQENLGESFFTDTRFLDVSETTLAKDDGVGEFFFTIDPETDPQGVYFGTEFNLLTADKLASFSVQGDEFVSDSIGVFDFLIKAVNENGEIEEGEIYRAGPFAIIDTYAADISTIIFELPETVSLKIIVEMSAA